MRTLAVALVTAVLAAAPAWPQQEKTLEVVGKIKAEAFDHSKVMDTLESLSDRYGPRLTASPQFQEAADWAMGQLKAYGLANVHAEHWGPFGRSWSIESYSLAMTAPQYSNLVAAPLAWSAPTNGVEQGEAIYAPIRPPANRFDLKQQNEALDKYEAEWKGKLKGKIVLVTELPPPKPETKPSFQRYTDAELTEIAQAPEPHILRDLSVDQLDIPAE